MRSVITRVDALTKGGVGHHKNDEPDEKEDGSNVPEDSETEKKRIVMSFGSISFRGHETCANIYIKFKIQKEIYSINQTFTLSKYKPSNWLNSNFL